MRSYHAKDDYRDGWPLDVLQGENQETLRSPAAACDRIGEVSGLGRLPVEVLASAVWRAARIRLVEKARQIR
jgi:hypothetical protein